MKVLLDECLPRKLKREVSGDVVRTVPEMGWASKKNGVLLRRQNVLGWRLRSSLAEAPLSHHTILNEAGLACDMELDRMFPVQDHLLRPVG